VRSFIFGRRILSGKEAWRGCRGFEGGGEGERTVGSADVMHRDGPIFELLLLLCCGKLDYSFESESLRLTAGQCRGRVQPSPGGGDRSVLFPGSWKAIHAWRAVL